MKLKKNEIDKEGIITEYLAGGISLRKLGKKHGINFRKIHDWVQAYQGKGKPRYNVTIEVKQSAQNPLPEDVKQLQNELRKLQLHNKLLQAMVDIGEEKYGIDLRKKSGAKQS
ncbi:MAG: hypothetical protein KA149_06940 [Chitinophagales bacterium]|nr:hypothetical protein [Chitinophagales bacterium]